jgi:hypothetical protein
MKVTPKMRVVAMSTLHYHNWAPGTSYREFESEIATMYGTAREFGRIVGLDQCSYSEYVQAMREVAE